VPYSRWCQAGRLLQSFSFRDKLGSNLFFDHGPAVWVELCWSSWR
jgi:hypothetical protein